MNIAHDIGYPSDLTSSANSISFPDSKDLLVDIGNNFVAEILDCCKMMNCKLTPAHVKKAIRLKFGIETDGPVEDFTIIKKRNMEHEKVDEKLNR